MRRLVVLIAAALLLTPVAFASNRHPTLNELENEVMCPVCGTTLAQSDSAAAKQIEREIQIRIKARWTKSQIKDMLVQQYGESILAAPPKHGFNLLAWVLPFVGIGAGAVVLAALAWRWSRGRPRGDPVEALAAPLDPELEQRVDDALARFDG